MTTVGRWSRIGRACMSDAAAGEYPILNMLITAHIFDVVVIILVCCGI